MKRLCIYLSFVLLAAMSGCTATYKKNDLTTPTVKLERGKSVAIATPADGSYGGDDYPSSGKTTALEVRKSFSLFSNSISIVDNCKDIVCLKGGQSPSDYYVIPEILHWEERATEWSGKPDVIEVKMSVYDNGASKPLASTIIYGKSKWATFGGDHPQDLLDTPVSSFVNSLY